MRKYNTNASRSIKKNKQKHKTSICKPPDQANAKNVDDTPDALEPGRPHPKPLSLHHIALSVQETDHCHSIVAHCHSIVAHCHSIVAHCHSIVTPPRDLIVITLILLSLFLSLLSTEIFEKEKQKQSIIMMRKYNTNARRSIKKSKQKQKTSICKPPDQANTKNVDDKPDAQEPG